jgi:hypothetical protein
MANVAWNDIFAINLPILYSFPSIVVLCLYIVKACVDDVLSSLINKSVTKIYWM